MNGPASRCVPLRGLPLLAKANILGLCAGAAALGWLLWPQWRHDDNLSHGIFLPVLSAILLAESRRDASPRFLQEGAWGVLSTLALVLLSLGSVAVAVVYAEALGWTHAMTEFLLACALVLALAAAWLGFADRRVRFMPVNWTAAVGITLWLFASPPPPGTYSRIAVLLQSRVTVGVMHVLNAVGIAAYQNGNVIELAGTSVGVSEACSGVRSLVSCTVAGLFLSALLVRRPASRAIVILASPLIGLAMNFLRSLILTLVANTGINIEGRWHDLTGALILVGTTVLVTALAFWIHRREPIPAGDRTEPTPRAPGRSPALGIVTAALLVVAATGGAFAARSQTQPGNEGTAPDLVRLLPDVPAGWSERATPDLEQFSGVLHTHALVEHSYAAGPAAQGERLTLYLAYWLPGEAPVSLVDAHTPDACWPGTGWEPAPVPSERSTLSIDGRVLPPAECRLFIRDGIQTRVWFWHLRGGKPVTYVDPRSALRLLRLAWRYGFTRPEDQLFIRVSSNLPWVDVAAQPVMRQFFGNLEPLGL